jgi:hypothetical protein
MLIVMDACYMQKWLNCVTTSLSPNIRLHVIQYGTKV